MTMLAIAIGGALGASLRYLAAQGAARMFGVGFPYGTLTVNVIGSLLMGVLAAYFLGREVTPVSAFALTGVLGGFTTFSAFSLDTVLLIEGGRMGAACVYIGFSVVLSVAALFVGMVTARMVLA